MSRFGLRAEERLRRGNDFQNVYAQGRRVSNQWLVVCARLNGLGHNRLGLSVGRRVGGAVQRNRWKRLLREAFRLSRPRLPRGLDLVLIARGSEPPSLSELRRVLPGLVRAARRQLLRQVGR